MNRLEKKINWLSEAALAGIVFTVPTFFYLEAADIYSVPKFWIFALGLTFLSILFTLESQIKKKWNFPLNIQQRHYTLLVMASLLLSWAWSIRPNISFFGAFFRMGGVLQMLCYLYFFVLAVAYLQNASAQTKALAAMRWAGFCVSLYAIIQAMGFDFFQQEVLDSFENRSFSSLGNPTALGAFLLFPIWAEWISLNTFKNRKIAMLRMAILLVALLLSRSQAAVIGLLFGVLLLAVSSLQSPWRQRSLMSIPIVLACIFVVFAMRGGDELRSLFSRWEIWKIGLNLAKDAPIFGYGPESFDYLFERSLSASFYLNEDYKNLVDRPHNEPLEFWINYGIPGLTLYAIGIAAAIRRIFQSKDRITKTSAIAILSLVATNFFSFSLVPHWVYISLFIALASNGASKRRNDQISIKTWPLYLTTLSCGAILVLSSGWMYSNWTLKNAYQSLQNGNPPSETIRLTQKVIQTAPQFSEVHSLSLNLLMPIFQKTPDPELYKLLEAIAKNGGQISHWDLQSSFDLAQFYEASKNNALAMQVYEEIHKTIGSQPYVLEAWADLEIKNGNYVKASEIYSELFQILPSYWRKNSVTDQLSYDRRRIFYKNHPDFRKTLRLAILAYKINGETKKAHELIEGL